MKRSVARRSTGSKTATAAPKSRTRGIPLAERQEKAQANDNFLVIRKGPNDDEAVLKQTPVVITSAERMFRDYPGSGYSESMRMFGTEADLEDYIRRVVDAEKLGLTMDELINETLGNLITADNYKSGMKADYDALVADYKNREGGTKLPASDISELMSLIVPNSAKVVTTGGHSGGGKAASLYERLLRVHDNEGPDAGKLLTVTGVRASKRDPNVLVGSTLKAPTPSTRAVGTVSMPHVAISFNQKDDGEFDEALATYTDVMNDITASAEADGDAETAALAQQAITDFEERRFKTEGVKSERQTVARSSTRAGTRSRVGRRPTRGRAAVQEAEDDIAEEVAERATVPRTRAGRRSTARTAAVEAVEEDIEEEVEDIVEEAAVASAAPRSRGRRARSNSNASNGSAGSAGSQEGSPTGARRGAGRRPARLRRAAQ